MKRIIKRITVLISLGVLIILFVNLYIKQSSEEYIYSNIDDIPKKQAIIILGAYVHNDHLSLVLEDRVNSGIMLYNSDKADKLLLSGDHGTVTYDEVNSMRKYILQASNIPSEALFLDHAGFDTLDTMYRAKEVFCVESAIIVTQDFHINRAVYIARSLGIDAVGYSVNQDKYIKVLQLRWSLREALARVKAFVDISIKSTPKYLGDKIPINGSGKLSWDEFDE